MDRRKSLKLLATGAMAVPAVISACNNENSNADTTSGDTVNPELSIDRSPDEIKYEKELLAKGKFFSDHETVTITILADIILPADDVSGSAVSAGVTNFIEFIVKDMPEHQVPMRGGLRWLDMQCVKQFEKSFKECSRDEQISVIDQIAYPAKAKPEMKPGVEFFNLMRNLTATGFYTSETGVKDLGYAGNQANQWNGVPADVLKKYNMAYTQKEMKECIQFEAN